jgi:hypothetical protein
MSPKPSGEQRQAVFDLLLAELRSARDAAVDDGADEAEIEDAADARRLMLDGSDPAPDD